MTLVALAATLAAAAPAAAQSAGEGPWVLTNTERPGRIDLIVVDRPESAVHYYERVGERRVELGRRVVPPGRAIDVLADAATWRCDRRTRRFEIDLERSDGTAGSAAYSVRTPSCADRFTLDVGAAAPAGARIRLRVRDGWRLGDVRPRLCVQSPRGNQVCRRIDLRGRPVAVRRIRLSARGRWHLTLHLAGRVVERREVAVGVRPDAAEDRPVVLVVGDSMVQSLDAALAEGLRSSARVIGAWRGGSGLSGSPAFWPAGAPRVARRHRPAVTVVMLGANDGYPIHGTPCCDSAWRALYAERALRTMRAFARHGGRVAWLLLPAMRDPRRQVIAEAVNAAVQDAAADHAATTVLHLDAVLTPDGAFRRTLSLCEQTLIVRSPDGVHLSLAGTRVAADLVLGRPPGCATGRRSAPFLSSQR